MEPDDTTYPLRKAFWKRTSVRFFLGDAQWVDLSAKVEVLPTLQVPGHPEVYIAGDLAGIQQNGHPLPMVAQMGIQTGSTAACNILRQILGQAAIPFRYRDKGTLDVIGRNAAVAYIWRRAFRGFLAWLIWVWVHIFNLIGYRNRFLVLIDWAWDYLFSEHSVRLIVPSKIHTGGGFTAMEIPEMGDFIAGTDSPTETGKSMVSSNERK